MSDIKAKDVVNYLKSVGLKVNNSESVKGNTLKESFTREETSDLTTLGVILTTIDNSTPMIEQGLKYLISNGYIKE